MLSTIFSFSLGDFYLNKNIVKAEGVHYASVSGFSSNDGHYIVTLTVGAGGAYVY
jgi:hypothetical protein